MLASPLPPCFRDTYNLSTSSLGCNALCMVIFHVSLSRWSFTFSRTLLSILAVLNNTVVWMVSTRPPTSKSSSPFNNPLFTVPKASITIGIIVTLMLHSFFNSLARSRYSFFQFYSVVSRESKVDYFANSLFFFCWLLGLVFWPRLRDLSICQSPIVVYLCHFLGQMLGCAYTICSYGLIQTS